MKLFKTIWHAKREAAIKPLEVLDQAIENTELDEEKVDAIQAVARKLVDECKPEAQPTEQPQGKAKVRVVRTAEECVAKYGMTVDEWKSLSKYKIKKINEIAYKDGQFDPDFDARAFAVEKGWLA